jgi:hypothetical protein
VPEIVEALMGYRSAHESPSKLVFPNGIPRASQLRKDEKANGIAHRDGLGRYADFHALRYTWATFLQRHGISQRFAMKLMRHSNIKLPAKVYTEETQLPIYDAIKNLPRLQKKERTQIRAQILVPEGQNGAQAGATGERMKSDKTLVNGRDCLGLAPLDGKGKVERAKGFEPSIQLLFFRNLLIYREL